MARMAVAIAFLAAALSVYAEEVTVQEVDAALLADSECPADGSSSDPGCALNALQLRASAHEPPVDTQQSKQEEEAAPAEDAASEEQPLGAQRTCITWGRGGCIRWGFFGGRRTCVGGFRRVCTRWR
mmetsp:Transcript_86379/g.268778  ORF Transcript_86379/g.268778 Transcript_86379/m.268778 type:complete len:127 (-) Transcript_86379:123-503(-)